MIFQGKKKYFDSEREHFQNQDGRKHFKKKLLSVN